MVTLEQLQRSPAQVGECVHRYATNLDFMKGWQKKPIQFTVCHKPCGAHSKHVEEGEIKLFGLNAKCYVSQKTNTVHRVWQHHAVEMLQQGQGSWLELMGRWRPNTGQPVRVCKRLETGAK